MGTQAIHLARTMAMRAPSVVDAVTAEYGRAAEGLRQGELAAALERFEGASSRAERLLAFLVLSRELVAPQDGALAAALDGCVRRILGLLDQVALALEGKDLVTVAMLAGAALPTALEAVIPLAGRVHGALDPASAAA